MYCSSLGIKFVDTIIRVIKISWNISNLPLVWCHHYSSQFFAAIIGQVCRHRYVAPTKNFSFLKKIGFRNSLFFDSIIQASPDIFIWLNCWIRFAMVDWMSFQIFNRCHRGSMIKMNKKCHRLSILFNHFFWCRNPMPERKKCYFWITVQIEDNRPTINP